MAKRENTNNDLYTLQKTKDLALWISQKYRRTGNTMSKYKKCNKWSRKHYAEN